MGKQEVIGSLILTLVCLLAVSTPAGARKTARVTEIIADKDGQFKVPGQKEPVIVAYPKEVLRLRITARKGSEWEADGAVHGFWAPALAEQGWYLRLREGTQEFTLTAPEDPGEYTILCSVICGPGHTRMNMKLVVREETAANKMVSPGR